MVHPSQSKITRMELHDVMQGCGRGGTREEKSQAAICYVMRKFDNDVNEKVVSKELRKKFLPSYFKKLKDQNHYFARFLKKQGEWLKGQVKLSEKCFPKLRKNDGPTKAFIESSESSKRKKTMVIRENYLEEELGAGAGDNVTAHLRTECRPTSPAQSKCILSEWKKEKEQSGVTLEEAWVLIRKCKLSKSTYFEIRSLAMFHGHNIYPPYNAVTAHQKRKRARKGIVADYQKFLNDTLDDSVQLFGSEVYQASTISEERRTGDQINCKKGDIFQTDINHSQEVMISDQSTNMKVLNTSFTGIKIEPQSIQFQVTSNKMDYSEITVKQLAAIQEHLSDIEYSQEISKHEMKVGPLNALFNEIEVEPHIIPFPVTSPTKVEYSEMKVMQPAAIQQHPTDIEYSQEISIHKLEMKVEPLHTSFTEIEVEPQIIQFPVTSTKMEY